MIAEMILTLIAGALTSVIRIIKPLLPVVELGEDIAQVMATILNISNQGLNFCHFILGDTMAYVLPIVAGLLAYKYIVYPIIDVVRRLIPFVNL